MSKNMWSYLEICGYAQRFEVVFRDMWWCLKICGDVRRNELKVSFDKLKTVLPELAASDKASKQQILDKAVDTVQMIKSTELSLMTRRNSLNKSNALLKDKLRKLKEELKISEHSKLGIGDW